MSDIAMTLITKQNLRNFPLLDELKDKSLKLALITQTL